ncbi:restriction endonuclease subunit S [Streptomyces sp. NPDC050504]|uniref:restriction endonuclease subunit S n=1 Tax=Streptomyces sp. NPDC050504 TaxID=3365618 RepID=UPI0037A5358C
MRTNSEVTWVPIRELGEVRMGKQLSPASRTTGQQYPYLRVANVFDGRIDYSDVNTMGFTSAERKTYSLRPGDILLNEGQSLELVGRSAIYDGPAGAFCFQNTLVRFRPGPQVLPNYAQIIFSHWLATGVFASIAKKTTSIAHLGGDRFSALQFPVIPMEHQNRIAKISKSLTESELLISTETHKRSLISSEAIEQLIAKIPASQYTLLSNIARVSGGVTLGRDIPAGAAISLPYLRVANVQDGHIDCTDMKSTQVLSSEVERYRVKKGDLLLTEGGDIDKLGRGALWDGRIDPCLHQNHVFRVTCESPLDPRFLERYTSSRPGRRYFLKVAKQTTNLASINSTQLKEMPIPCPPPATQRTVIEFSEAAKEHQAAMRSEQAKLKAIRNGILADLLMDH